MQQLETVMEERIELFFSSLFHVFIAESKASRGAVRGAEKAAPRGDLGRVHQAVPAPVSVPSLLLC